MDRVFDLKCHYIAIHSRGKQNLTWDIRKPYVCGPSEKTEALEQRAKESQQRCQVKKKLDIATLKRVCLWPLKNGESEKLEQAKRKASTKKMPL